MPPFTPKSRPFSMVSEIIKKLTHQKYVGVKELEIGPRLTFENFEDNHNTENEKKSCVVEFRVLKGQQSLEFHAVCCVPHKFISTHQRKMI